MPTSQSGQVTMKHYLIFFACLGAFAQEPTPTPPGGNRLMGVLPNYRTADASQEGSILSARQKLSIARKDTFDYPLIMVSGLFAGISQASGQPPSFGGGVQGYAHRLATNYADQAMGNLFTEGFCPAALHQDPRYFRRGSGTFKINDLRANQLRLVWMSRSQGFTRLFELQKAGALTESQYQAALAKLIG